eukprot:6208682-Pleurochrysis_carterae.AAC.1
MLRLDQQGVRSVADRVRSRSLNASFIRRATSCYRAGKKLHWDRDPSVRPSREGGKKQGEWDLPARGSAGA